MPKFNVKYIKITIVLVFVACFGLFITSIVSMVNAKQTGSRNGESVGKTVGSVIGSFSGFQEAMDGYEQGHNDGLSAEDTEAYITKSFKNVGKLEVLASSITLTNVNSVGEDYKALYLLKGDAIFTVDLSQVTCTIDMSKNKVIVYAPLPVADIYINDTETEKIATYQKNNWTGKSEDGYLQYMNSMENAESEIKEKVANYDSLVEAAKQAEKQQIELLVLSIRGGVDVYVEFNENK